MRSKTLLATVAAVAAERTLSQHLEIAGHLGYIPKMDDRYTQGGAPGEPGHGRPSVTRKKKAKTNGKNKRKRK